MKTVILAGGFGTRLAEHTEVRPKPMVEIGGRPILWHILKHYAHYGFREFYLALGYRSEVIKRYFLDYYTLSSNLVVDLGSGSIDVRDRRAEDWQVHLIDTGLDTNTGGRVLALESELRGGPFLLTYGDGVSDVDLDALVAFHRRQGVLATITAVRPPARFGGLSLDGPRVAEFTEKPQIGEGWINGGFMVLEPEVIDYIPDLQTNLEAHALERLAAEGQLAAYRHESFWQCMDTKRDLRVLEKLWGDGKSPWMVWND